jgi:hypothetical protein
MKNWWSINDALAITTFCVIAIGIITAMACYTMIFSIYTYFFGLPE